MSCEREQEAKRHVMCSNTPEGRLEQLESCVIVYLACKPFRKLTSVGLRKGLQAKYTITRFSGNGQRMRTNIVAKETRPSFFLNFN